MQCKKGVLKLTRHSGRAGALEKPVCPKGFWLRHAVFGVVSGLFRGFREFFCLELLTLHAFSYRYLGLGVHVDAQGSQGFGFRVSALG